MCTAEAIARSRRLRRSAAEGRANHEIPQMPGANQRAAEAMRRLNIHDTARLVRLAVRTGLLSSER
jgi:hypothetical protein